MDNLKAKVSLKAKDSPKARDNRKAKDSPKVRDNRKARDSLKVKDSLKARDNRKIKDKMINRHVFLPMVNQEAQHHLKNLETANTFISVELEFSTQCHVPLELLLIQQSEFVIGLKMCLDVVDKIILLKILILPKTLLLPSNNNDFDGFRDCYDIKHFYPNSKSGVYTVYPRLSGACGKPVRVFCDMESEGGGWTVFQSRK